MTHRPLTAVRASCQNATPAGGAGLCPARRGACVFPSQISIPKRSRLSLGRAAWQPSHTWLFIVKLMEVKVFY